MKVRPSKEIWQYFERGGGTITPLYIASSIADVLAGYHISYSATELLKDLGMLSAKGNITKIGREALAMHLHAEHHKSIEPLIVIKPEGV